MSIRSHPQFRCPRSLGALVVGLAVLLTAGCGAKNHGRERVSGAVTFQGRPLDNGSIQFLATTEPGGTVGGAVISAGRYELPGEQGLAPGTYKVSITAPEPDPSAKGSFPPTRERIPASFNAQTTQTVEVRAGHPNRFDFTID